MEKFRSTRLLYYLFLASAMIGEMSGIQAQTPILDRNISLELSDVQLTDALEQLAEAGDFYLAYNPSILPRNQRVSTQLHTESVATGLKEILAETPVIYRVLGDHVLLRPLPASSSPKPVVTTPPLTLSGLVRDSKTGKPISEAGLEILPSGQTIQTDEQGRFSLKIPSGDSLQLNIYKAGFRPGALSIRANQDQSLGIIELFPIQVDAMESRVMQPELTVPRNPLEEMVWVRLLVQSSVLTEQNTPNQLTPVWGQASFIPPLGTNWREGGKRINHLSFNMLAGYAGALKGLEIGGLLNATRYHMSGVQVAGLANAVGGAARGFQIAGGFNLNQATLSGMQFAGVLNTAFELNGGLQVAGTANLLRYEMRGAQIAGIINLSPGEIRGAQLAGLTSLSWGKVQGAQLSGLLNISKDLHGVQIAPINIGREINGLQLGLINLSKRVNGIPIGVLSLVDEGHQSLTVGADEWWPMLVSLRLGVPRLYNLFEWGMRWQEGKQLMGYSYGLGTYIGKLENKHRFKWEASATGIIQNPQPGVRPQLRFLWERKWASGLFLEAGPSLSLFISYPEQQIDPNDSFLPYAISSHVEQGKLKRQWWAGVKVGLGWQREKKSKKN